MERRGKERKGKERGEQGRGEDRPIFGYTKLKISELKVQLSGRAYT